jgi:hypothetical protein
LAIWIPHGVLEALKTQSRGLAGFALQSHNAQAMPNLTAVNRAYADLEHVIADLAALSPQADRREVLFRLGRVMLQLRRAIDEVSSIAR